MDDAAAFATAESFATALQLRSGELALSIGRGGTVRVDLPPHLSNAASAAAPEAGGPNGGYLAALALAASVEVLGALQPPRGLSIQFLSSPAFAPMALTVEVLRAGRSAAFAAFRGRQGERLRIAGQASFGAASAEVGFLEAMPDVPPPEACGDVPLPDGFKPHFTRAIDYRWASRATPFGGDAEPVLKCWMRVKGQPLDARAACFLLDGIFPSFFMAADRPHPNVSVDLRVDFTAALDRLEARDDFALVVFRTRDWRLGAEGWALDDAELWSRDGGLLATARQQRKLLARPARPAV